MKTQNAEKVTMGEVYIERVRNRLLKKNKNWLAIICGETGSGKSYSAISLAYAISGATGKVFIIFTPLEFLELINSGELNQGDVIIFDEAGVGMSAREWYSIQNKLIGSVLQTFRNLNIAVIFTTPNLSFIDVQARKLFHSYLETNHIDRRAGLAYVKPYEIQVQVRFNKLWYNYPRMVIDGQQVSCSMLAIPKPPAAISEDYEKRKTIYTTELNKRAYETIKESLTKAAPATDTYEDNGINIFEGKA